MNLLALGVSHHTAPLKVREKLAFIPHEVKAALASLPQELAGAVFLSTCNRLEVYALGADLATSQRCLEEFLARQRGLDRGEFYPYLRTYIQEEAMRHLFRVAAGVDSMVLGEDQIQAQVRRALELSLEVRSAPRPLSRLFRHALMVGKRVRRETLISRYPASVSHAAVLLARRLLGDLSSCTVFIISAGETGKLTGKILKESRARRVLIANRTPSRAQALASALGGEAMPFSELVQGMAQADIVISSTGAPGSILGPSQVRQAMASRPGRTLLIIDIAVPRDIDPEVKGIEGVSLYNIDDLQAITQESLGERRKEVQKVEAIVEEEVTRARRWWRAQEAVPIIVSLKGRAEAIRQKEVEKAVKKLGLHAHDREHLDALTRSLLNKLLHHPVSRLKADPSLRETVRELFGLKEDA